MEAFDVCSLDLLKQDFLQAFVSVNLKLLLLIFFWGILFFFLKNIGNLISITKKNALRNFSKKISTEVGKSLVYN